MAERAEQVELAEAVRCAISKLPAPQRQVLLLRHYQDLPLSEIPQSLGVPIGTAKSRLSAARRHLRRRLELSGVGPEGMVEAHDTPKAQATVAFAESQFVDSPVLVERWRRVAWTQELFHRHALTGDLHWEKTLASRGRQTGGTGAKGAGSMGTTMIPETGVHSITKANRARLTELRKAARSPVATAADFHRLGAFIVDLDEAGGVPVRLFEESRQALDRAIALDPGDPAVRWTRGWLYERWSERWRDEALASFRTAVAIQPEQEKNHFQYISAHRSRGRMEACIQEYGERLQAKPDDAQGYAYLAFAYYAARQFAEVLETAERGLGPAPDGKFLHYYRAESLLALGRAEEAEKAFHRALAIDPGFVDCHYSLAGLYDRTGRVDLAIVEWEAVLAHHLAEDPSDPYLSRIRGELARLRARRST